MTMKRTWIPWLYAGISISIVMTMTVRGEFVSRSGPIDVILMLMLAYSLTSLCIVDARLAGRPLCYSSQWLIFYSWPITVPICMFRTRRWRGLLLMFGYFWILLLAVLVTAAVLVAA